jgi:hypothetical protein
VTRTMAWQQIETAPRDGSQILGFMPSDNQGAGGQSVIAWVNGWWFDHRAFAAAPTHWMPLPAPPEEGV